MKDENDALGNFYIMGSGRPYDWEKKPNGELTGNIVSNRGVIYTTRNTFLEGERPESESHLPRNKEVFTHRNPNNGELSYLWVELSPDGAQCVQLLNHRPAALENPRSALSADEKLFVDPRENTRCKNPAALAALAAKGGLWRQSSSSTYAIPHSTECTRDGQHALYYPCDINGNFKNPQYGSLEGPRKQGRFVGPYIMVPVETGYRAAAINPRTNEPVLSMHNLLPQPTQGTYASTEQYGTDTPLPQPVYAQQQSQYYSQQQPSAASSSPPLDQGWRPFVDDQGTRWYQHSDGGLFYYDPGNTTLAGDDVYWQYVEPGSRSVSVPAIFVPSMTGGDTCITKTEADLIPVQAAGISSGTFDLTGVARSLGESTSYTASTAPEYPEGSQQPARQRAEGRAARAANAGGSRSNTHRRLVRGKEHDRESPEGPRAKRGRRQGQG